MNSRMLFKTDANPHYGEPLSTIDMARHKQIDTSTPQEHLCKKCLDLDKTISTPVVIDGKWECVYHGTDTTFTKKCMVLTEAEYIKEREKYMKGTELTTYKSPLLVPIHEAAQLKKQLLYSMVNLRELGPFADHAATALAQLALSYNLDPLQGELWILPVKSKGETKDFQVFVGYKGWLRAAHRAAKEQDVDNDFILAANSKKRLTVQEVLERMAHYCTRCNGQGGSTYGDKFYPCKKCNGKKMFEPADVIVIQIPLIDFSTHKRLKEMGIDPKEGWVWGTGVWQPGDNIVEGKDPAWQCEKRASVDAIRRKYQLPFTYLEAMMPSGSRAAVVQDETGEENIVIEGESTAVIEPVLDIADLAGMDYSDNPEAFKKFIETLITEFKLESPAHAIDILRETGAAVYTEKNEKALHAAVKKELGKDDPNRFDRPADGKEKFDAQKVMAEFGYAQGKVQQSLLTAVYGEKFTWVNITHGALMNLVYYAKKAKIITPETKGEYESVDKAKDALKETVRKATEANEFIEELK